MIRNIDIFTAAVHAVAPDEPEQMIAMFTHMMGEEWAEAETLAPDGARLMQIFRGPHGKVLGAMMLESISETLLNSLNDDQKKKLLEVRRSARKGLN